MRRWVEEHLARVEGLVVRDVGLLDDIGQLHRADGDGDVVARWSYGEDPPCAARGDEQYLADSKFSGVAGVAADGPGQAVAADRPHGGRATIDDHHVRLVGD